MHRTTNRRTRIAAALAAVSITATACSTAATASKAGGSTEPYTLTLATSDDVGTPTGLQVVEFARRVAELSDQRITIEPTYSLGAGEPAWDQVSIRRVVAGESDLALVPTRAWDTEGVTSFRVLQAPMVLDSEDLVGDLLQSEHVDDMLAGLEGAGVEGLALYPSGMRRLFLTPAVVEAGRSPASPAQLRGMVVRVPLSEMSNTVVQALGIRPIDINGKEELEALAEGAVQGVEASLAFGAPDPVNTTVGNVVLYPRVNVLVANAEAFSRLPEDDRRILREAAAAMVPWSIDEVVTEASGAEKFCKFGSILEATEEELQAFRDAFAPVIAELRTDELAARVLDDIEAMRTPAHRPAHVPACTAAALDLLPHVVNDPADMAAFPHGVYRTEITTEMLRANGVTHAEDIRINKGVFTWTLDNGTYLLHQRFDGEVWEENGTFDVDGDLVTIYLPSIIGVQGEVKGRGLGITFRWELTDEGALRLHADLPEPILDTVFTTTTWSRIGDIE